MRVILAIQEAHDSTAALMVNGEIVAAAQEERFSGLKCDYGYPEKSIKHCLQQAGIKASHIDDVVLCSQKWNPVLTKIKRNANFSVKDWVTEQNDYWKPKFYEDREVCYYDLYKDRADFVYDQTYPIDHLLKGFWDDEEMRQLVQIRKDIVAQKLGLPVSRISIVTHEDCHTFYSYFGSPMRGNVLALTTEGTGDYSNGTVSTFSETGRQEIAVDTENHLGHIYQYITLLLGMKPSHHEYKIMGLAPYANRKELERSLKVFETILKVEGLHIKFNEKPRDLYFHFLYSMQGHRFDGIAGALQQFLENLLTEWVQNCVSETGLKRIVFSGGVAQNIKACKKISELELVEDFFVCPAAGDPSLPIGACYYTMFNYVTKNNLDLGIIKPLDNIYLGPEYTKEEIDSVLREKGIYSKFKVSDDFDPRDIAKLLAAGKIIARCSGRMEFGLRALGNRSILANPSDHHIVRKINDAIKFRDFWMPFTPTILSERESDYIVNPKSLKSPFMTMAFESTALAQKELIAALHPADLTVRPQILLENRNPGYYSILKEFEKLTGIGGVLNTSFNLHGMPIVLGPEEAIFTFESSQLDGVLIGDRYIAR
ncbi:carbamoyltransferase C-terminal domain-containing protein [candidate division CSSED10-310 bacterium]|uniref:Carbamoyltransferase C-terminal domain-containing protein n=1 Tax=candidate division CSSED10-310 bacterium TaxID=2855610 RepID=A0ABV6YZ06_UNCC1